MILVQKYFVVSTVCKTAPPPSSINPSPSNRPSPNRYPNDAGRFGDTAANVGVLTLLEAFESTRSLPLPVKSAAGSVAAGLWRIGLTPIDAYKTTLQVVSVSDMWHLIRCRHPCEIDWDRLVCCRLWFFATTKLKRKVRQWKLRECSAR